MKNLPTFEQFLNEAKAASYPGTSQEDGDPQKMAKNFGEDLKKCFYFDDSNKDKKYQAAFKELLKLYNDNLTPQKWMDVDSSDWTGEWNFDTKNKVAKFSVERRSGSQSPQKYDFALLFGPNHKSAIDRILKPV